jgi:hypothetical protein
LPTIKIDLDSDSFQRLTELAVEERRPIPWQAEVLLLRALTRAHRRQNALKASLSQSKEVAKDISLQSAEMVGTEQVRTSRDAATVNEVLAVP